MESFDFSTGLQRNLEALGPTIRSFAMLNNSPQFLEGHHSIADIPHVWAIFSQVTGGRLKLGKIVPRSPGAGVRSVTRCKWCEVSCVDEARRAG